MISSFAWGAVARGLGNWGARTYSTWWNNDIFWANVCQIVIPIGIILLLIFLTKRNRCILIGNLSCNSIYDGPPRISVLNSSAMRSFLVL